MRMKNNRLPVYCQLSFLISFLQNRPQSNDVVESSEEKKWRMFSEMIHSNSETYIDATEEMIKTNMNYTKFLLKAHSAGNISLKTFMHEQLDDDFFQTVNPHTIFLFSDKEKCKEYQDDYGMLFISEEDIYKSQITQPFDEELSQLDPQYGWSILYKYKHPCNAMVIADNYLLDDPSLIEKNLLEVLRRILPDELRKTDFHLTIITNCKDFKTQKYNIKNRCDFLDKKILAFKKPYKIVLKIIGTPGSDLHKLHDRNIITNHIRFYSGKGISLSKNVKFQANTRVTIGFINNNNIFNNVNTLIELYITAENHAQDFVVTKKGARNRLLKYR